MRIRTSVTRPAIDYKVIRQSLREGNQAWRRGRGVRPFWRQNQKRGRRGSECGRQGMRCGRQRSRCGRQGTRCDRQGNRCSSLVGRGRSVVVWEAGDEV